MCSLYISRRLKVDQEILSEEEVLERSNLNVVLAAPGSGKTELLQHFAGLLQTQLIRASVFRRRTYSAQVPNLVIDAMDEVAKIGHDALNDIIEKARSLAANNVIFASRSGEWETSLTRFVEDCFEKKITEIYLDEFNQNEQKALFEDTFPNEDFDSFIKEAEKFDLLPLLGNPEFLKLFGYAYIENNKKFSSKRQIYSDAARRLASESNQNRSHKGRPDVSRIVQQAGGIFARLLLSGASGVSKVEILGDRDFPYASIVSSEIPEGIDHLLDSKLFKPAGDVNEHEPIHRIMAEYLAGEYLADRVSNSNDPLSLNRCFSVIAPNDVVREELRGMLGWMAALGTPEVQYRAIQIDPYAVLGNGDPSQLSLKHKVFLIEHLRELAEHSPHFRNMDRWRSFNVGQFFVDEVIEVIRPILLSRQENHLLPLILELLEGSTAVRKLSPELESLIVDSSINEHARYAALSLLFNTENYRGAHLFDQLIKEKSPTSLQLLTTILGKEGDDKIVFEKMIMLFHALADLYPISDNDQKKQGLSRYFIKRFLRTLKPERIIDYISILTADLACTCSSKKYHNCECNRGISKVVGGLLDRYFETHITPHDPVHLWGWIKNLSFSRHPQANESLAIKVLQEDAKIRQALQSLAFSEKSDENDYKELSHQFTFGNLHLGLRFRENDRTVLVNDAYHASNTALWNVLWRNHSYANVARSADELRSLMRFQANQNADFLKIWSKNDRESKLWWRNNKTNHYSGPRRHERQIEKNRLKRIEHFQRNRSEIEGGRHWGWLREFSDYYLSKPEKFDEIVDNVEVAHNALRNCLPFLLEHVPSISEIGKGRWGDLATVLYSLCLLHFRERQSLEHIPMNVLKVVKTQCYEREGISSEEGKIFELELDRLIFSEPASVEEFARLYIEASLQEIKDNVIDVEWLSNKPAFQSLQKTLPLEWLNRFPNMPFDAERRLFRMAARYNQNAELKALISKRCDDYLCLGIDISNEDTIKNDRKMFWVINSFFYDDDEKIWKELIAKKENMLFLVNRFDYAYGDVNDAAIMLTPDKIYKILDAFIEKWPEVKRPYSNDSNQGERAHRFLKDMAWRFLKVASKQSILLIERLLKDQRFNRFNNDLLTIRANSFNKIALQDYRAPSPQDICNMLQRKGFASVEDLRAFLIDTISFIEKEIRYAETDTLSTFYKENGNHVDENTARNRIVESLKGYMTARALSVVIEHHMVDGNRCDITAAVQMEGERKLLTIEVKGQWHKELFSAAALQLAERYSTNPDAEKQGIYLVLWFGEDVSVAGKKNEEFKSPEELKEAIVNAMSIDLRSKIDVKVIDLSKRLSKKEIVSDAQKRI